MKRVETARERERNKRKEKPSRKRSSSHKQKDFFFSLSPLIIADAGMRRWRFIVGESEVWVLPRTRRYKANAATKVYFIPFFWGGGRRERGVNEDRESVYFLGAQSDTQSSSPI